MKYRFSFAMCLIILTLFNLGEAKELKNKNKIRPFGSSEEEINDIEGEDLPDQNVFEKELNNQQLQTIIQEAKLNYMYNLAAGILSPFLEEKSKQEIIKEVSNVFQLNQICTKNELRALYKNKIKSLNVVMNDDEKEIKVIEERKVETNEKNEKNEKK